MATAENNKQNICRIVKKILKKFYFYDTKMSNKNYCGKE